MGKTTASSPLSRSTAAEASPPREWLALTYQPVSPFSLRPSHSTSAGGKTLLVPTPYAIKLALIDTTIRQAGVAAGEHVLGILKETAIALLPSFRACVTNTFVRSLVRHQPKGKDEDEDKDDGDEPDGEQGRPFKTTIRYREICVLSGPMVIAFGLRDRKLAELIEDAARRVNYFGKRGGFFQPVDSQIVTEIDPRATVVDPTGWTPAITPAGEVACFLDDLGPRATLSRISPYDDERAEWDQERVTAMRILAVRRIASGARFTAYQRLGD